MELEMADVEAQNGTSNRGIVRNPDAAAIFKNPNRPVTLKVRACSSLIIVVHGIAN